MRLSTEHVCLQSQAIFFIPHFLSSYFPVCNTAALDITMSFGFSVGDFLAAIQLANKIRKEFADAPTQFKAISDEYVV